MSPGVGRRARVPLAQMLADEGAITQEQLLTALALQRHQDLPIGEILITNGMIDEDQLVSALTRQYGTRALDLAAEPADAALSRLLPARQAIALGALPWRRAGAALVVATSRPDREDEIRAAFADERQIILAIAGRTQMQDELTRLYGAELARRAESRAPSHVSCRSWRPAVLTRRALALAALALLAGALYPVQTAWALLALAAVAFLANMGLKLCAAAAALWPGAGHADTPDPGPETQVPIPLRRQPVVSILVPLFRERDIAGQLIRRLERLDYPRALLDILLVLEADDLTTRRALAACDLPHWIRPIVVPPGRPRTKPRALNYALTFTRGSIIGIYDAEDRPEPDQIRKIVRRFHRVPPEVACLQGRLDYYNPRHNWMSRCFTMEYATWFRLLLPGVQRLGLFVPLGGTTLFLRADALREVGAWDAHNVTEDAELGLRLARAGYRTEMVDTTTFEEANSAPWSWIRQRSRWLKGYAMTWASAMRAPRRLWRELGPRRFIGFQVQIAGAVLGFLTAPVLWSLAFIPLGLPHPLAGAIGPAVFPTIAGVGFAALALSLGLTALACRAPHLRWLRLWVPTTAFYFPLASVAAVIALCELVLRPFHWAKTAHGAFGGRGRRPRPLR